MSFVLIMCLKIKIYFRWQSLCSMAALVFVFLYQRHMETRLLYNLSYPYDESAVNFNISKEASHVKYASLRMMPSSLFATTFQQFFFWRGGGGGGGGGAKSDIKGTLRLVPMRPSDHRRMGFMW